MEIFNSGIGSHTPFYALDSASVYTVLCGAAQNFVFALEKNSPHDCTVYVPQRAVYSFIRSKIRHGYTRVPDHALLARCSSGRIVVYIYYITTAGNSISSQLGSSCQGNEYCTEKTGSSACPSYTKSHLPGHSPPASQLGGPPC